MGSLPTHCRRCLLPAGKLNVRLDESGLCNYCRYWDETKDVLLNFERNRPLFVDRLNRYREQFHYDAAVGLSGGKDSAYVFDQLRSKYGANLLAITFDNGFLTPYAWRNIQEITRTSGGDHLVYRPDWGAYREFYRATLKRLGDPCVACSIGGYILSVRGCRDLRIPFFLHGRSPMQMFRAWYPGTRDLGLGLIRRNLTEHSPSALRRDYQTIIRRMQMLLFYLVPNLRVRRRILSELLGSRLRRHELVPELLGYFLYEPYDEVSIVAHLESVNSGYRRPDNHTILGHHDCLIHDACAHLFERQHGFNRVLPDLAGMLRQGMITQEQAHPILAANTPPAEDVETSIGHLLERLEMSRDDFDKIVRRLGRKASKLPFG